MTTSAEMGHKGIQPREFLNAGLTSKMEPRTSFTELIISNGHGHERVSMLAQGVPVAKAEKVRVRAKLGQILFSDILGYSAVHYKRLIKDKSKLLRPVASNRLFRFAQILEHAIELYDGDQDTAMRWLSHPNPAFGDQAPMEMLKSEVGADMVDKLISQLELGILPV